MKRYVKYTGDNPIIIEGFKDSSCEVVDSSKSGLVWIMFKGEKVSCYPDGKLSKWVFCDEHGNELDDKKKQGYKGQFDLAACDICTPRFVDKKGSVVSDDFNVTEALNRIAEGLG